MFFFSKLFPWTVRHILSSRIDNYNSKFYQDSAIQDSLEYFSMVLMEIYLLDIDESLFFPRGQSYFLWIESPRFASSRTHYLWIVLYWMLPLYWFWYHIYFLSWVLHLGFGFFYIAYCTIALTSEKCVTNSISMCLVFLIIYLLNFSIKHDVGAAGFA